MNCRRGAWSAAIAAVGWLAAADVRQDSNLPLFKRDTQVLEQIIQQLLKQNFTHPFALTAPPRGAYLQGYGVAFCFQLNINRGKIRTPFGETTIPGSAGQRSKAAEIRLVKETMVQCLADYGNSVKQLGPRDRISIQAHIEDRSELDPAKSETVVVLTVSKEDLGLLAVKKLSLDQFRERVHILEY
jgi:hypothetical protein